MKYIPMMVCVVDEKWACLRGGEDLIKMRRIKKKKQITICDTMRIHRINLMSNRKRIYHKTNREKLELNLSLN